MKFHNRTDINTYICTYFNLHIRQKFHLWAASNHLHHCYMPTDHHCHMVVQTLEGWSQRYPNIQFPFRRNPQLSNSPYATLWIKEIQITLRLILVVAMYCVKPVQSITQPPTLLAGWEGSLVHAVHPMFLGH